MDRKKVFISVTVSSLGTECKGRVMDAFNAHLEPNFVFINDFNRLFL